jgi:hypothetical protein
MCEYVGTEKKETGRRQHDNEALLPVEYVTYHCSSSSLRSLSDLSASPLSRFFMSSYEASRLASCSAFSCGRGEQKRHRG